MMRNYLLPALSACLLVLVILALPGKDIYKLNAAEMIKRIGGHEHIITTDHLKTNGMEGHVLVDLRDRDKFMESHLPGAVNLPAEKLDVKSIRDFFNETGFYVLYGKESALASQVWILITQMGIENVSVLETVPVSVQSD